MQWSLPELLNACRVTGERLDVVAHTAGFATPLRLPAMLERPGTVGRAHKHRFLAAPSKQPDGEFCVVFRTATPEEFRENTKRLNAENRARLVRRLRGLARRVLKALHH
jgi:hypothetical protein